MEVLQGTLARAHSCTCTCPSVCLGTCTLYRFTAQRETFPEVCADNGGANPGYQWKWLPLLISTSDTYEVDAEKAQLEIHGVGRRSQSTCFKQLYAVSGLRARNGKEGSFGNNLGTEEVEVALTKSGPSRAPGARAKSCVRMRGTSVLDLYAHDVPSLPWRVCPGL